MGAADPFEIWTDHQNLQYFKKPQKLNHRQARWMTELAEYHFTLHHIPGKRNIKADALSRWDDHDKGENDNQDEILLKAEHSRVTHHNRPLEYDLQPSDDDFYEKIRTSSKNHNPSIIQALEKHEKGWKELDNGVITF
jgi:hypothetical protein